MVQDVVQVVARKALVVGDVSSVMPVVVGPWGFSGGFVGDEGAAGWGSSAEEPSGLGPGGGQQLDNVVPPRRGWGFIHGVTQPSPGQGPGCRGLAGEALRETLDLLSQGGGEP